MRQRALLLALLLMPVAASAQGIRVTSVYQPAEVRTGTDAGFVQVGTRLPTLDIGDEVRTGPGGAMTLELPDGSYVVVSENTTLEIEKFWGSDVRNLMNVIMGKVRFFIQRWGGRPNPYRVNTPTALIAVRGTTFDVRVGSTGVTEVVCLDGRVAVESIGLSDREVILDPGRRTQVRPGEYPLTPVDIDDGFGATRVVEVVRRGDDPAGTPHGSIPAGVAGAIVNNDRRNPDSLSRPDGNRSILTPDIQRGKLSFPQ